MRKEDLTVPAIIAEAIEIIVGLIYIGMQIYYGLSNHVPPYKFICNIVGLLLVYAGLTILSNHPEQVNRLKTEVCVGKVRKYTLRMLRLIKFVFVVGLYSLSSFISCHYFSVPIFLFSELPPFIVYFIMLAYSNNRLYSIT